MKGTKDTELIAYCGLFCGDCFIHKGEIADMARDLRKKLRQEKFDKISIGLSKYFKSFKDYEKCYDALGGMVRLRCKRGCREDGGNPNCKIRNCCIKKNIKGCWECDDFENCKKFDALLPLHDDAMIKNLRKLRKKGEKEFLKGKRYK